MQESYKGIEEGRTNEENFVCDQHPWPGGSGNSAAGTFAPPGAEEYEISLYVLLGQGEMISQVPQRVHVKNKKICTASVLSGAGRRKLIQTSFLAFFRHGRTIKKMQYVIQNFFRMKKTGNIQPDKLLWRVISDGADRFSEILRSGGCLPGRRFCLLRCRSCEC